MGSFALVVARRVVAGTAKGMKRAAPSDLSAKRNENNEMNKRRTIQRMAGCALLVFMTAAAHAAEPLYQNNFEQAEVGSVPDEFLVMDGQFAVREHEGNKVLELPGAPLETYGFLMGPAQKEGLAVSARFHGTSRGRKFPTFAVSLNSVGGFRLRVAPAKKAVELVKNDAPVVSVPFEWKSGVWTSLKLQIRKAAEGLWKVEGKAWLEGQSEPDAWTVVWDEAQEPVNGRPGAWGSPFSGTPIWYDDVVVSAADE
jgi:hypothetical protein